MLPRTFSRSLANHTAALSSAHHTCSCACGVLFRSHGPLPTGPLTSAGGQQQRRAKSNDRPAPSTRRKQQDRDPRAVSAAYKKNIEDIKELESSLIYKLLQTGFAKEWIHMTPDTGLEFLNRFAEMESKERGRLILDVKRFRALIEELNLTDLDLFFLSSSLLKGRREEDKTLGKKMLNTLAAAGHAEATIRILNNALLANKTEPGSLKLPNVKEARKQLKAITAEGRSHRAMVLEGKIAFEEGNDEYAIQCWERAVGKAIEASEEEMVYRKQRAARGALSEVDAPKFRDASELSSPWVELTLIHYERYITASYNRKHDVVANFRILQKAKEFCQVGCDQDDPTSHFHMADIFSKEFHQDGSQKYTSTWLYHITKAAASTHVRACYVLAEFYASSGWKFIEDEPPDAAKPTPFDSYPGPSTSTPANLLWSLVPFTNTKEQNQASTDPRLAIFHTATFPSRPADRYQLAFRWLSICRTFNYAPAALLECKMRLEPNLWGQAFTPPSASSLSSSRYLYASKEDHDNGIEIPGRKEALQSELDREAKTAGAKDPGGDVPNPHFNPDLAKEALTNVFYAIEAHRLRQTLLTQMVQKKARWHRVRGAAAPADLESYNGDELLNLRSLPGEVPWWIRKWYEFEDVREMYEGEVEGLEREAKGICEGRGWDVMEPGGGLLYKCGLAPGKGKAAANGAG